MQPIPQLFRQHTLQKTLWNQEPLLDACDLSCDVNGCLAIIIIIIKIIIIIMIIINDKNNDNNNEFFINQVNHTSNLHLNNKSILRNLKTF